MIFPRFPDPNFNLVPRISCSERLLSSVAEEKIVGEEQRNGALSSRTVSKSKNQRADQLHQLHFHGERVQVRGDGDLSRFLRQVVRDRRLRSQTRVADRCWLSMRETRRTRAFSRHVQRLGRDASTLEETEETLRFTERQFSERTGDGERQLLRHR